jgi:hypothetical protein
MTIKQIRDDKEIAKAFIAYFKDELESYDEFLIGDVTDDYIFNTFESQGYWSGVKYNFSYNDELDMIDVEERNFAMKGWK